MTVRPAMTVEAAVQRDIDAIAKRDPELAASAFAANALALAREMDSRNSATSKSMCARALNETLGLLRELAPPAETKDAIDDLADRRKRRRARASSA